MGVVEILLSVCSGIAGAVLALIGNHLVSKRTTEMQMKTTVLTSFMTARLSAYQDFLNALKVWSAKRDIPACSDIYRAASAITLVGSEETICALSPVQNSVRLFETTGIMPEETTWEHDLLALQFAMRNDLLTYRAPDVKLKEPKISTH